MLEFIKIINSGYAGVLSLLSSLIMVVVTIIYVGHTKRQANYAKESAELVAKQMKIDKQPCIVPYVTDSCGSAWDIEIHEAEACKDHIHMLESIPPKYSVLQIMGYLKGKSSLMIYEKYANLKYKYGNRHFWCRGYYVSTVGRNRRAIEEYIRNQLQEDYTDDQFSIKEFVDPFTGEPVRGGK